MNSAAALAAASAVAAPAAASESKSQPAAKLKLLEALEAFASRAAARWQEDHDLDQFLSHLIPALAKLRKGGCALYPEERGAVTIAVHVLFGEQ